MVFTGLTSRAQRSAWCAEHSALPMEFSKYPVKSPDLRLPGPVTQANGIAQVAFGVRAVCDDHHNDGSSVFCLAA